MMAINAAEIMAARGALRGTHPHAAPPVAAAAPDNAGDVLAKRLKVLRGACDKADERNTHTMTFHDV
jgi:hypothetical protein